MSIYYFHFWIIFIKYLYIFSITSTTHVYYIVYGVPGQPPCIVKKKKKKKKNGSASDSRSEGCVT